MNIYEKNLSLFAFLKASTMALIVGCLLCSVILKTSLVNSENKGLIRIFEKKVEFFKALAHKESSSRFDKVNKFGYLGKYQFGEEALIGLGYYKKDGSAKNDWRGEWTGKYGILSKQDFINNPLVQEIAIRELTVSNWKIAKAHKLDKFLGKKIHGTYITQEGILAAMHLKGPRSVNSFIFHGVDSTDALGTGVKEYMQWFSRVAV